MEKFFGVFLLRSEFLLYICTAKIKIILEIID